MSDARGRADAAQTIALTDLTEPTGLERAVASWRGFAELRPAARSAPPRPALLLNADHPDWYQANHLDVGEAPPVGCHFLHDVAIIDHGLRVHQGRIITDDSGLSPASLELWGHRRESEPDKAVTARAPIRVPYGVVIHDAGYWIHGHWLVDFLPRVAVALRTLGAMSDVVPFILPDDTPHWAFSLLKHFFGLDLRSIVLYNRTREAVICDRLCVPNYLHSDEYFFHPFFAEFYRRYHQARPGKRRKLAISRRNYESYTRGALKRFENRGYFERAATARGYEVICPETLPVAAQIQLFSTASIVISEYGSGLHNALFSPEGAVVGSLRMLNGIQSRIGAAMGQLNLYGFPDREWRDERSGDTYCLSADRIDAFIDAADALSRGELQDGRERSTEASGS